MGIPNLETEGFLPAGIHDASVEEIRDCFGCFQTSDQRCRLYEKFAAFVSEVRLTGFVVALLIDGSFVTGKREPGDIDLLLLLPHDFDFSAERRPFEYNVLSKRHVRKTYALDLLVAVEGSELAGEYAEFYQQIRGRSDLRKGILRLTL